MVVVVRQKKVVASTESELESSEASLQEALAKVLRLRRQRDTAKARLEELVDRGIRELDEVDGVRSQEQAILNEQQAVGDAQSLGAFGLIDWSAIPLDEFSETALPVAGSSSNA
jgi:hypothetical protein